jgi:hypothetical protein
MPIPPVFWTRIARVAKAVVTAGVGAAVGAGGVTGTGASGTAIVELSNAFGARLAALEREADDLRVENAGCEIELALCEGE